MVKDNHIAWHAGVSNWFTFKNLNKTSIGIELENKGHRYGYQNFTSKQIFSLIKVLKILKKNLEYKIKILLAIQILPLIERLIQEKNFHGKSLVNTICLFGIH